MSRHVADHVFQSVAGGDTLFCDVVSYSEKTDIAFCSVKVYDKIALVGVDVTAIGNATMLRSATTGILSNLY